jgi:hypothetical protein
VGVVDAAELAGRFGLGQAPKLSGGPVARGRQGEVWRLETADGCWAVKVAFHESSEDRVRVSTQFQEAACAAGVPAPSMRRATDGCVFARVGGRQVRVYEWVDLDEPDPGLDPGLVGGAVAAIHRVRVPADGPVDPWYAAPVGATGWDRLVERLRAAGPGQELVCVLFEFGRSDPGRARALMSAYAAAGGPATVTRPGDFSMLIAQLGHIAEIAATDWLEPNVRNPARAGAAAWIGEILDEPHTRDVLRALLHAVSDTGRPMPPRPSAQQDTSSTRP